MISLKWASYFVLAILVIACLFLPNGRNLTPYWKTTLGVEPNKPVLVIHADMRSAGNRRLASSLEMLIQRRGLPVSLVVKSTSSAYFQASLETTRSLSRDFPLHCPSDFFGFYEKKAQPLFEGDIHMDRGRIKRLLLDYFGIDPAEEARQAFQIGDHVKNTVLATTARPSMGQRTVYAIYEHSCFACESGKVLTNLEEMAERFPNTRFNFVLTRSYRKKDIETFIEDYKVSIPVLIADHSFREFWDETRDPDTYPHLLNGLLLALEKDGTIGLIKNTEEIELLESWLLSSKNQEI